VVTGAVLTLVLAGVGTGSGAAGPPTAHPTVDGGFDVTGYDITMDYRPDTRTLRGTTTITATATEALDGFTLHLDGPEARSVVVDSAATSFAPAGERNLVVTPARTIARGATFHVRVDYDGTPGPGWLPTESGGATAFQGSTSAWFPVHDDAFDRADFRLTATAPAGWSVVSIGREAPPPPGAPANTVRWTEPDVDPAAVAVSVDRFTLDRSVLADGTPVVDAYAPGLREATEPLADRLPDVLRFLSAAFGRYPFDAAGNVFVHVNDDGPGTAPQTRPVYLGAGNERFTTLDVVVHEQAHQWYGVSAAPARSEDACLAECFATYATWMWDEAENGVDLDTRYRERVDAEQDDVDFWLELYRPGRAPGFAVYGKGPLALHALRRQVGEDAFRRLLVRWPQEHSSSHVDWPRFEVFAERVTGQELDVFFQAWFRDGTIPAHDHLWPGALTPRP
jgi:aminopeptidase N